MAEEEKKNERRTERCGDCFMIVYVDDNTVKAQGFDKEDKPYGTVTKPMPGRKCRITDKTHKWEKVVTNQGISDE